MPEANQRPTDAPAALSNRRDLLRGLAAGAGIAMLPSASRRAEPHELVAQAASKVRQGRPVELRLVYPEGCLPNLQPIIESWQTATGIAIKTSPARVDEIASQLMLEEMAEVQNWDVALPATFAMPDLIEAGCTADLSTLAAKHEPPELRQGMLFDVGDYYQNRLHGYQTDGDCYLLFYNQRLLDDQERKDRFEQQHGRKLGPARTWSELDQAMAFFAAEANGGHTSTFFRTIGYAAWEWWLRFTAKGRFVLDENLEPTIDGPEGVAALEELLAATAHQYGNSRSNGLFDNWTAYSSGKHFCNLGWGGTQKALRRQGSRIRDSVLVAPPPGSDVKPGPETISYFNWGWNFTVARRSKETELAYLFCLFAICPTPSLAAVRQDGFFDPFRREHHDDPGIRDAYGAQFLQVHQRSLAAATPDLYLRAQAEYLDALRKEVHAAIAGEVTATVAMTTAAEAWRRIIERQDRTKQAAQWQSLKLRYPKELRPWLR